MNYLDKILLMKIADFWPTLIAVTMAIGFYAFLVLYWEGYSASNKDNETQIANYQSYQAAYKNCHDVSASLDDFKKCFATQKHPSASEYRAQQDLNAQREMAYWAKSMLYATLLTFVVTGIGVVFVAYSFKEARMATKAAIDSANAAHKANDVAREAYLADQRPWLKIIPNDIVEVGETDTHWFGFFGVRCKNLGRSPAVDVIFHHKIFLHEGSINQREQADIFKVEILKKARSEKELSIVIFNGEDLHELSTDANIIMGNGTDRMFGHIIYGVAYRCFGVKEDFIVTAHSSFFEFAHDPNTVGLNLKGIVKGRKYTCLMSHSGLFESHETNVEKN